MPKAGFYLNTQFKWHEIGSQKHWASVPFIPKQFNLRKFVYTMKGTTIKEGEKNGTSPSPFQIPAHWLTSWAFHCAGILRRMFTPGANNACQWQIGIFSIAQTQIHFLLLHLILNPSPEGERLSSISNEMVTLKFRLQSKLPVQVRKNLTFVENSNFNSQLQGHVPIANGIVWRINFPLLEERLKKSRN